MDKLNELELKYKIIYRSDFVKHYEFQKKLGKGSFGAVF